LFARCLYTRVLLFFSSAKIRFISKEIKSKCFRMGWSPAHNKLLHKLELIRLVLESTRRSTGGFVMDFNNDMRVQRTRCM
jgi:hypothetical protein